ncbi:hypothetical protein E2C01_034261 [Portunus trituberculatus]|uniref:Uncharacterized protein n=1 Tax=Portunus trituberculatus TaxID=210409 RepID=A0A5B7F5P2_PORTR|nr:hypothetical protein [Portunus trituberculatus]
MYTKESVRKWNHERFGVRRVSKRTGSNPVHGPSVGCASSLGDTVSLRVGFEIGDAQKIQYHPPGHVQLFGVETLSCLYSVCKPIFSREIDGISLSNP